MTQQEQIKMFPYHVTIKTKDGKYLAMDSYASTSKAYRVAREIIRWSELNHNAIRTFVHSRLSGKLLRTVDAPKWRLASYSNGEEN